MQCIDCDFYSSDAEEIEEHEVDYGHEFYDDAPEWTI